MFEGSTTQPTKFIWPAARALAAEKTWLVQFLKAPLRNLRSLSGRKGGLFQPKSVTVISYYSSSYWCYGLRGHFHFEMERLQEKLDECVIQLRVQEKFG